MTLYAGRRWQPTPGQFALARRLADVALLVLLDVAASLPVAPIAAANGIADGAAEVQPAELALLLRADVHRAAGIVMAQSGVSIDQALARLRAHAFAAGEPLPDVAAAVLERRLRLDADGKTSE